MGKFRLKLKGGKGKRWSKSNSSVCNPEKTVHRDAVRSKYFSNGKFISTTSNRHTGDGLSVEALKHHDAFQTFCKEGAKSDVSTATTEMDVLSLSALSLSTNSCKTFDTFASDWSNCTTNSFQRLLRGFRPDTDVKKEMLAILAAVTEVIRSNNGQETDTEYYAALMTTLEAVETIDSITAVLTLLGQCMKKVPNSVLKAKFPETSKVFMDLFSKVASEENIPLLKTLIGCLSVILRAQDPSVWNDQYTLIMFDAILAFVTHGKPKIRKASQHAVCAILRGSSFMANPETAPTFHPAASHVADVVVKALHRMLEERGTHVVNSVLYLITLIGEILASLPKDTLKRSCESILRCLTLSEPVVTLCCWKSLGTLFASNPSVSCLPPKINAKLLSALHDFQPSSADRYLAPQWMGTVAKGINHLAKLNGPLCSMHLRPFFEMGMQCLLEEKASVGAYDAMAFVLDESVPHLLEKTSPIIPEVLNMLELGLKYQYHAVWEHVLRLLKMFFNVCGTTYPNVILPTLSSLAQLRDSDQFSNRKELDDAVSTAITILGPRLVLQAIPLQITGEETSLEFRRSWILPLLKDSIRKTELEFFTVYFLPLANTCRQRSQQCAIEKQMAASQTYDMLQKQLWATLPGFCIDPTDIQESFKVIARALGSSLTERPDIRSSVLGGLRRISISCTAENKEQDRAEVGRFGKNFIPILFNLYTTEPHTPQEIEARLSVLETVKVFLQVCPTTLHLSLCNTVLDKVKTNPEESSFIRLSLLDLVVSMLPFQDMATMERAYEFAVPGLSSKDRHLQKKSYRILETICDGKTPCSSEFLQSKLKSLRKLLVNTLSSSAPTSKGPRLRCLSLLLKSLKADDDKFLELLVPEAVLCCRDVNEKTRTAAYNLLVQVGRSLLEWSNDSVEDTTRRYLQLLLVGLAGSPSLINATLLALARILHEFRDILPSDAMNLLLENMCLLMSSHSREVVGGSLSFCKVLLSGNTQDRIQYLPKVARSLSEMTDDCKRHFRMKLRELLQFMVRKFGANVVCKLVPRQDVILHKRLRNLCKEESRKKRKGEANKKENNGKKNRNTYNEGLSGVLAESDSESESEIQPSRRGGKKTTWIQEDDEIVDLLESSAAQKITGTNPQSKKKSRASAFKQDSDGRIIIAQDKEEIDNSEDSDNERKVQTPSGKRKRGSSDKSSVSQATKYQAGGSGIHRPIRKKAKRPSSVHSASTYASHRAGGDKKIQGKPDPYSYVPLSRKDAGRRKGKSGKNWSIPKGKKGQKNSGKGRSK